VQCTIENILIIYYTVYSSGREFGGQPESGSLNGPNSGFGLFLAASVAVVGTFVILYVKRNTFPSFASSLVSLLRDFPDARGTVLG
jgi:hypothetical protein